MDTLIFYFDRSFGRSLPDALRKANPPFEIEFQHDPKGKHKFKQDTPDDKWLSVAGENGWIVFSHDRKFHRIEAECAAMKQFKIGCFYLWGREAPTWDKLCCFVYAQKRIVEVAATTARPFIFEIGKTGRLKRINIP